MSIRHILTLTAAALLAAPVLHAQAPAAPATPVPPTGAPTTSTPATPAAKPKPLSSQDAKAVVDILESLQFHIRMSESAKWKKDEAELTEFGGKAHKELTAQFTPLVNYAMQHGVDNKNIPAEATKGDKQDISKINKEKGDKYLLEYFELFAKKGKQNVRSGEMAIKAFTDPEVKDLATKAVAAISNQTQIAEAKHKELKGKK